nr:nuclear transport factor 2 family protein [Saprospiraceae bacterium]
MDNIALVNRFYQAFSENDGKTMADFYDENATFQDDVFGKLNAAEVKAMWQMLTARSKDLVVT